MRRPPAPEGIDRSQRCSPAITSVGHNCCCGRRHHRGSPKTDPAPSQGSFVVPEGFPDSLCSSFPSGSEGFGWGCTGCLERREESGNGPGGDADDRRGEQDQRLDRGRPVSGDGDDGDCENTEDGAEDAGEASSQGGFECDLSCDLTAGGAERPAKSDLGSAFDDVEQGGICDGDGTDEQCQSGECVEEGLDVAFDLVAERSGVGWYEGLEAVGVLGRSARGAWWPMSWAAPGRVSMMTWRSAFRCRTGLSAAVVGMMIESRRSGLR